MGPSPEPICSAGGPSAFLAEASRLLAASLDFETTLTTVAGMALPRLGDWCFVDIIQAGNRMRRLAVIHPDPAMRTLARGLEDGWPPRRDDPFGVPHAVRTRRSEVIPAVSDEMLRAAAHCEENLDRLRQLGIGSLMVVPLIARDEVLGAITYVSPREGDGYAEQDLELAEDLAARCAVAIDNARLFSEAQRARDVAERASRAKSDFLATMSHEIRTPVNAVIGYADLLEAGIAGPLSADQARYLERIKASNRHLLGLISDVLDLAKLEADRVQIRLEAVAVGPVVEAALDLVRPRVEGRAVALPDACEGDAGTRFVGDVDRVRQILVNLLSNAVKFTLDGGRIRVSCGQTDDPDDARVPDDIELWTYVRVEDNGIGIGPDHAEQLFEPFTQVDSGYTRSTEGTGLGLTISRRLARLMNGDLTLESRLGEGSSFTLWLPAAGRAAGGSPGSATRDPAAVPAERTRGVAAIGVQLLRQADEIAARFADRLRAQSPAPHGDEAIDAVLADHSVSLLADLGQTLVLLEKAGDDGAELLRDASAIQRTIADRHGLQRRRIGWTVEALDAEFDLLRAEVERVVREVSRTEPAANADRALELLDGFIEQARRGSLRAFRLASHREAP